MMAFLKKCFSAGWPTDRIVSVYEAACSKAYDFSKNVRLE